MVEWFVKHRLKLVLVLLIVSLGINISLLIIQSFYIPVYIFSMSQAEEYEDTIAQLNDATARFRTNMVEKRIFVYGEPDIYIPVREISVRRSDFDLILAHNYFYKFSSIMRANE